VLQIALGERDGLMARAGRGAASMGGAGSELESEGKSGRILKRQRRLFLDGVGVHSLSQEQLGEVSRTEERAQFGSVSLTVGREGTTRSFFSL
jgi:hypothetical protein